MYAHEKTVHNTYEFVENKGQWHESVLFAADIAQGFLLFHKDGVTIHLQDYSEYNELHTSPDKSVDVNDLKVRGHVVKLNFENANPNLKLKGDDAFTHSRNYFIGNKPDEWVSGAKGFSELIYENVYAGIDLRFYTKGDYLKYDFIVHPGANPNDISMKWEGTDGLTETRKNSYKIKTLLGNFEETGLRCYQKEKEIESSYKFEDTKVSFKIGNYNNASDLIIDPILIFSSLSGSTANNFGNTATFDNEGFLYSGSTAFGQSAKKYPTTVGAYQTTISAGNGSNTDIAISKFDTTGTFLVYSTYLGGNNDEMPHSLVVNKAGELYVFGTTGSSNFAIVNAFDSVFDGGTALSLGGFGMNYENGCDIIVSKFSSDGSQLLSSTFAGGTANDGINESTSLLYNYADEARGEVSLDKDENVYVVSCTKSSNFPVTSGVFQSSKSSFQDGVILKFNADLNNLLWGSYIGGTGDDAVYSIVMDEDDNLYIAGGTSSSDFPATVGSFYSTYKGGTADGFIAHISSDGTQNMESTYYGSNAYDQIYFVEVDRKFDVYIFGQTEASGNTLISNAAYFDSNSGQVVAKFSKDLSSRIWSTVFGTGKGSPDISPTAFLVDLCNSVYLSGWGSPIQGGTLSTSGLVTTADAYDSSTDGSDFYLMVLEVDASNVKYASYFGGTGSEHVDGGTSRFDKKGKIYQAVCAACGITTFPTTAGVVSTVDGTGSSGGCNLGVFKMDFLLPMIVADFDYLKPFSGCVPFDIDFINRSLSQDSTKYYWEFGDGQLDSLITHPDNIYLDTGTYTIRLIATDITSCNLKDTAYVDLTIFKKPEPVSSFSTSQLNSCDSLFLDGFSSSPSPDLTYNWYLDDDEFSTEAQWQTFLVDTGFHEIILIATDSICGTSDTSFAEIYYSYQTDIIGMLDYTVDHRCDTFDLVFTGELISSNNPKDFMWEINGEGLTGDSVSYTINAEGTYTIVLTVTDICEFTDTVMKEITLDYVPFLEADFSYTNSSACDTFNLVFSAESSGIEDVISYEWDINGIAYDGKSTQVELSNNGNYPVILTITDVCGISDTVMKDLDLFYEAFAEANYSDSIVSVCDTFDVYLNAFNGGVEPTLSYSWEIDGVAYTDKDPHVQFVSNGTYPIRLTLTDVCGVIDILTDDITVQYTPFVEAHITDSISNVCDTFDVFLDAYNAGIEITQNYTWDIDGTIYTGENLQIQIVSNGNYPILLSITDVCGVTDTVIKSIELIYTPFVVADLSYSTTNTCDTFVVSVQGGASGMEDILSYEWDIDNTYYSGQNTQAQVVSNGTYPIVLTVTDVCLTQDTISANIVLNYTPFVEAELTYSTSNSCDTFLVNLTGSANGQENILSYEWEINGIPYTGDSPQSQLVSNGIYPVSLTVTDVCLTEDTTTAEIYLEYIPVVQANFEYTSIEECNRLTVTTENTSLGENLSYLWNVDPSYVSVEEDVVSTFAGAGTYNVMLTVTDRCDDIDTAWKKITYDGGDYLINAAFNVAQFDYCSPIANTFNQSVGNNLTYLWEVEDREYYTEDIAYNFKMEGFFNITLTIVDTLCDLTDFIVAPVEIEGIFLDLKIGEDKFLCNPDTLTLTSNYTNVEYFWSDGSKTPYMDVTRPGIYTLMIRDSVCFDRDTVQIKATPVVPDLSQNHSICIGEEVTLYPVYDDIKKIEWFDLDSARYKIVADSGDYLFNITDQYGCTTTDTMFVRQTQSSLGVWFPNAFTPDHDGLNDEYKPVGIGIKDYEMYIFNRWGNEIFHTTDFEKGWTGDEKMKNDMPAPNGTYVYIITYRNECENDQPKKIYGVVNLIR